MQKILKLKPQAYPSLEVLWLFQTFERPQPNRLQPTTPNQQQTSTTAITSSQYKAKSQLSDDAMKEKLKILVPNAGANHPSFFNVNFPLTMGP